MVVLDTSAVIDLARGNPSLSSKLLEFEKNGVVLRISSITVFELCSGFPPGLEEKRRLLLQKMAVVSFNEAHAESAGKIHSILRRAGQEIGALDAMIAAVALTESEVLLTRNVKHFARVPNLKVQEY